MTTSNGHNGNGSNGHAQPSELQSLELGAALDKLNGEQGATVPATPASNARGDDGLTTKERLRLYRRALHNKWPVGRTRREDACKALMDVVLDSGAEAGHRVRAVAALVAADRNNIARQSEARQLLEKMGPEDPQRHLHMHVELTAEQAAGYARAIQAATEEEALLRGKASTGCDDQE